ncbi:hypothetical protein MYCTH_2124857 [Thermothelomyces thermophilus ATCC 42464]|uniref:Uncharacterized protein n=1 Tax=Thermothelomyces thermophilus (strain ATCC 42464 / BCRC 31852 / DSM 1799) TaxID=573729 RepID=G2QAQ3_THET4|nr:uncharacterized protein MYCTH_2124857 [Thermothelomyces thermophilus ATCC 42464]AEO55895.1 hypothetical protein MYCTH_2124857 [Thermothelomyces thermophilus ATCC 42464]
MDRSSFYSYMCELWVSYLSSRQTANGRYHVRQTNLNEATQVQPLTFRRWLDNVWAFTF